MKSNSIHSNRITIASLLVALGIIYGDIGTSPLYVLKAIVGEKQIDEILVLGGVSCVFWTLVFQTPVKYIWLTLKADNDGEGGIFSLYALVSRYGKKLVIPAILGATTLLADGIITPPISVASAVEGLEACDSRTFPLYRLLSLSFLYFFSFSDSAHKKWVSHFRAGDGHLVHHVICSWLQPDHALSRYIKITESCIMRYELLAKYPAWVLVAGCSFSLYYRCRSIVFRSWSLRQKKYPHHLGYL